MATQSKPESTAVAKTEKAAKLPAEFQARVDEARQKNALIAAVRGTIWGKELNETAIRAVAQYCRENNLDAVRHVEVLGGRIYLTAEFYDERGAELVRQGTVQPDEPDYINADDRLEKLAATGDQWAADELVRRLRERIRYNVPENAKAAVVQRFRLTATGAVVTGVNWCGAGTKRDPVGDAEPSKTAQTRARRRAWKQIADVIPAYAAQVRPIEAAAKIVAPAVAVVESSVDHEVRQLQRGTIGSAMQAAGGYDSTGDMERITPRAEIPDPMQEDFIDDRDLADEEEK